MPQWHLSRKLLASATQHKSCGDPRDSNAFLTGLATKILDGSGWGVPDFPAAPQDLAKK
jgi:hypothetical protein